MDPSKTHRLPILRWPDTGPPEHRLDELAVEEPLELRVDNRPVMVTMRTPGHDEELAAGFLLTEGLIQSRRDLLKMAPHPRHDSGNVLGVFLAEGVCIDFARLQRHVFMSSSCGLCGKASIDSVHQRFKKLSSRIRVEASLLLRLPERLRARQETFTATGGLHAAAVFDTRGRLVVVREDVGRHNAVDKVLGYGLRRGLLPFDRHVLLVSGRASFEIVQKALAARIPVIAAVSAPSSLAVEFALASRQTLVGFLREGRMNVYAHPERIRPTAPRVGARGRATISPPRC